MLCLHPNLIYGLSVLNAKRIKQAIDVYHSYYFVPSVGNESTWIKATELMWNEIYEQVSNLLNAKQASAAILSSKVASDLEALQTSLNIPTRLRLLDGAESVPFDTGEGSVSEITFVNGPYNLDNQNIIINGVYMSVADTAILRSSKLTSISENLRIDLIGNGVINSISVGIEENSVFNNFHITRKLGYIELSLVGSSPYYCFQVVPNAASRELELQSGFIDTNSVLYTSARELAQKTGGTLHTTSSIKNVSIVNGVLSESLGRCFLVLLDKNNEIVAANGTSATNYCNTSLTYNGKARIVYEYITVTVENANTTMLPPVLVSTVSSNIVKTSIASALSVGDIVLDRGNRIEVLKVANNTLTLAGKYYSSNLNVILGCYDTWHNMTDGLEVPDIQFPSSVDSNTILQLRKISSQIDSFIALLLTRLNTLLTRNQLSAILPLLNELQRQHLAMRASRACDILFQGDIESYMLLDNTTSNYNLSIRQSTEELKARL